MSEKAAGGMDGWMDEWVDGWMDGWSKEISKDRRRESVNGIEVTGRTKDDAKKKPTLRCNLAEPTVRAGGRIRRRLPSHTTPSQSTAQTTPTTPTTTPTTPPPAFTLPAPFPSKILPPLPPALAVSSPPTVRTTTVVLCDGVVVAPGGTVVVPNAFREGLVIS